ncbi:MAG: low specificity L-threonine aldolase [Deltaproteobacteria bacterium]|nr:low specificity L-threonine aldolase [Deltaproteobacteria bacterium]
MVRKEFRSDTMTLPTQAMRDAMRDAEVGDDVCEEDPTINRLQEMAADMLGKEEGLFVPSGTAGNQCAVGVHTRPGNELIVSETSHTIDHEVGASGALWGVQTRIILPTSKRYLTKEDIAARLRLVDDVHEPDTGLIILENALSDGTVMPIEEMRSVKELAEKHGIRVHLDGARLFNGALTLEVDPKEITAHADSVMICLAKGLGAPVGSLLLGTTDFIKHARKVRKMMGGGMRQAGVLAAPGIIALTEGVERLAEDHANAKLLGNLLAEISGIIVDCESVQTNMVFCRVDKMGRTEAGLVEYLNNNSFHAYRPAWYGLRFVTSREVNEEDVRALVKTVGDYLE